MTLGELLFEHGASHITERGTSPDELIRAAEQTDLDRDAVAVDHAGAIKVYLIDERGYMQEQPYCTLLPIAEAE